MNSKHFAELSLVLLISGSREKDGKREGGRGREIGCAYVCPFEVR